MQLDVELIHPPFGPLSTGIFHPSIRHTSYPALLAALAISTMASLKLIDGQFDRAVEIVQGLPKNGPIQTDYEEKLTMYRQVVFFAFEKVEGSCYLIYCSLFKQGAYSPLLGCKHLPNALNVSDGRQCPERQAWHVGYARSG